MKEFEAYDKPIADYLRNLKGVAAPLLSWDYHAQGASTAFQDIRALLRFATEHDWVIDESIGRNLSPRQVIVVTDPDIRIVFATRNMTAMNGYQAKEVIGLSPRTFQGPATDPAARKRIRQAIAERRPFQEVLVNYFKDGTPYDCLVKGFPVFDSAGALRHFIAFETAA